MSKSFNINLFVILLTDLNIDSRPLLELAILTIFFMSSNKMFYLDYMTIISKNN